MAQRRDTRPRWTTEEDNILIHEIKNYPTNLQHAFDEAHDKLTILNVNKPDNNRTREGVEMRWYGYLRRATRVNAVTCGSKKGFTKNVKNTHRDDEGNLPNQGLQHHLYLIKEILNLPVRQRNAIVTLLTSN